MLERGRHEDLLCRDGLYAKLCRGSLIMEPESDSILRFLPHDKTRHPRRSPPGIASNTSRRRYAAVCLTGKD